MILYGSDYSPFVRRVSLWCAMQERPLERRTPRLTDPAFAEVKRRNPFARIPVLELDDGTALIETFAICDWLEETAPEGRKLIPSAGLPRRAAMQRIAYGNSAAEKAVAMFYERNRRPEALHWHEWQERIVGQIRDGLSELDALTPAQAWGGGATPDGGDLAAICAFQFVEATNPQLLDAPLPNLRGLVARAMAIPAVADTRPA